VPQNADFYLCGPPRFLADMQTSLSTWIEASRIHTEVFGPLVSFAPGVVDSTNGIPHFPTGIQGSGPIVSCPRGVCHPWESGLVDGQLAYSPEPLDPPSEGNALICCSTPTSNVELDL